MRRRRGRRLRRVLILLLVLVLGMYLLMRSRFNPIAKDLAMMPLPSRLPGIIFSMTGLFTLKKI